METDKKRVLSVDINVNSSVDYQNDDGTWGNKHSIFEQSSDGSLISVDIVKK